MDAVMYYCTGLTCEPNGALWLVGMAFQLAGTALEFATIFGVLVALPCWVAWDVWRKVTGKAK